MTKSDNPMNSAPPFRSIPVDAENQPLVPGSITLDTPIVRGDQTITAVSVRRPAAGELRGIALADLMRLDVAALITLLPRITAPTLTSADVSQLQLPDLMQLGTEVVGFFLTKADRSSVYPAG